jgi:AcrR family transcriptional regulator
MPRTRAVSPAKKDARRTAILTAAAQLFQNAPYDQILMQQIADQANLAKGTLFLYFESKEHLFLALTVEALHQWLADLNADLRSETPPLMTLAFTRLVERSLRRQPLLLPLLTLHPQRLAESMSAATQQDLQNALHPSLTTCAALTEHLLPYLQPGQGRLILQRILALIIGLPGSAALTPADDSPSDVFAELAAVLNLQLYALETLHRRKSATATTAN